MSAIDRQRYGAGIAEMLQQKNPNWRFILTLELGIVALTEPSDPDGIVARLAAVEVSNLLSLHEQAIDLANRFMGEAARDSSSKPRFQKKLTELRSKAQQMLGPHGICASASCSGYRDFARDGVLQALCYRCFCSIEREDYEPCSRCRGKGCDDCLHKGVTKTRATP